MNEKKTPRPKRGVKPNRRYLDSEVWCNNVSIESLPSPTPPLPPATSTPVVVLPPNRKQTTAQHPLPNQRNPKKINARNGAKTKNFIRFRFQIDCAVAADLNIDDLVSFLKANVKIDGKKNNLAEVTIEKRSSNVHILSKVMMKKKYLKRMVKQYLGKKKMFNYRVLQKNKRSYKVVLKL